MNRYSAQVTEKNDIYLLLMCLFIWCRTYSNDLDAGKSISRAKFQGPTPSNGPSNGFVPHHTLLQDLTQDSATLTGWRRSHRSGEGKMIALYGPGIC